MSEEIATASINTSLAWTGLRGGGSLIRRLRRVLIVPKYTVEAHRIQRLDSRSAFVPSLTGR